jgi:hypothetical protein
MTYPGMKPTDPSAMGWVARIGIYDPSDIYAPQGGPGKGWVSLNTLGEPVPGNSNAAHIPVFGNPAPYNPRPVSDELWPYFAELLRRVGGP